MMMRLSSRRITNFGFVILAALLWTARPAAAQSTLIYWTGAADNDSSWHNLTNWVDGAAVQRVPAPGDTVYLGHPDYCDNTHQNIDLTDNAEITFLRLSGTDQRTVSLSAPTNVVLTVSGGSHAVLMASTATADAELDVRIYGSHPSTRTSITQQSLNARMIIGPNGTVSSGYSYRLAYGPGIIEVRGILIGRWLSGTSLQLVAANEDGTFVSERYSPGDGTAIYISRNTILGGWLQGGVGVTTMALIDSGTQDRVFTINSYMDGDPGRVTRIGDSPDGSSGHLTVRVPYFATDSQEIETSANSTIEIYGSVGSLASSANAGISGEGNLLLRRATAANVFSVNRAMTYTGRTMLETGILSLASAGYLPTNTIVEIGANAGLRVNHERTVGGLSAYNATYGTVDLNGGALTVNASQASGFAGAITGTGTLVKAGVETFTLSAGYTNVVGRTLRAAGGVLAVTGVLSVEAGDFELAGGRITAGSLASTGAVWNVTLHEANEGQTLVTVATNADITGATLALGLAEGYKPEYGKEYTLLYAGSITGAGAGGLLFGITDGDSFVQNGQEYMIRWENGSEQIILTAIPEPGSLALLALAGSWLWFKRRRRHG